MSTRALVSLALWWGLAGCVPAGPAREGAAAEPPGVAVDAREPTQARDGGASGPAPTPSAAGDAPPAQPAPTPAGPAAALARLANDHRRALGCDSLAWDADLGNVAAAHSRAMHRLGFFDHIDPQGRDAFARVRAAGITGWSRVAENLALTPRDPPDVLRMWLNSPGHRANLENCALDRHGIAVEDGYWTHLFTG